MDTSHHPKTVATSKTATTDDKKPPAEIVFVGLCLFIVTDDYAAVALLKPLPQEDGGHVAHSASDHAAYFYEHAKDRGTVGDPESVRSFPDETGGQWIGTELTGTRSYGDEADLKPDTSLLQSMQYRLPNLRTLGKQGGRRDLSITWPNLAQAVIVLYGGALEPRAPVLKDFRIDWDFRTKEEVEIPADRRMFLAEQVVWKSQVEGASGTVLIANVPFETVKTSEEDDEKQLLHFESFYQVFTGNSKDPVLLPTNPSDDVEVYPIFCPPALYEA